MGGVTKESLFNLQQGKAIFVFQGTQTGSVAVSTFFPVGIQGSFARDEVAEA
jgi:hypothetical protein